MALMINKYLYCTRILYFEYFGNQMPVLFQVNLSVPFSPKGTTVHCGHVGTQHGGVQTVFWCLQTHLKNGQILKFSFFVFAVTRTKIVKSA